MFSSKKNILNQVKLNIDDVRIINPHDIFETNEKKFKTSFYNCLFAIPIPISNIYVIGKTLTMYL